MTQQEKGPDLHSDIDGSVTCIGHLWESQTYIFNLEICTTWTQKSVATARNPYHTRKGPESSVIKVVQHHTITVEFVGMGNPRNLA